MEQNPVLFEGNCSTSVVRQAKYRVVSKGSSYAIEIVIETSDGLRLYPTAREHPGLVEMVNDIKRAKAGADGGQFYINEFRQVIVPAGEPLQYFMAGEYEHDIVLKLADREFNGRPHDDEGNLLKPGDEWTGRPRPGIRYTLKAGGQDIEYARVISEGIEQVMRLSKVLTPAEARRTAGKIAQHRGNKGGAFYINEFQALFAPIKEEDGWTYKFLGVLRDDDPWFPKWTPSGTPGGSPPSAERPTPAPQADQSSRNGTGPQPKTMEIEDNAIGYSFDHLFEDYLHGASSVLVEDPYIQRPHQIGNFLRLCELAVRLGTIRRVKLVTQKPLDDGLAKLESIRRSLKAYNVTLDVEYNGRLHDRKIEVESGWEIHLGRGLDIYKRPDDFAGVGATDFLLRPCHPCRIIYQRKGANN